MGRIVGSVIVGYNVVVAVFFATFSAAFLMMGSDRAFQPGSYEVSGLWIGVSLVLGFIAALAGGRVSAAVARGPKGPRVLAIVVLLLGLLFAIPVLSSSPKTEPRTGDVPNLEAMAKFIQPRWIALAKPIIGAVGVTLGGRREVAAGAT